LANRWVGPSTEPSGSVLADVDFLLGFRVMNSLGVSINDDKLDTLDSGIYHPVNGRATGTANSHYFNSCKCFDSWCNLRHS
jgi:hypothetical protein